MTPSISISRPSSAVANLEFYPFSKVVFVDFQNGSEYCYKFRLRDLTRLMLNRKASLGQFINTYLDLRSPL